MAQHCHSPIILASFNLLLWFYGSDLYYFDSLLLLLAVILRRKLLPDTSINKFMLTICNKAFVAQEKRQNANLNYAIFIYMWRSSLKGSTVVRYTVFMLLSMS